MMNIGKHLDTEYRRNLDSFKLDFSSLNFLQNRKKYLKPLDKQNLVVIFD